MLFVGKNKVILGSEGGLGCFGVLRGAPGDPVVVFYTFLIETLLENLQNLLWWSPGGFLYIFNWNSIRKPPESAVVAAWCGYSDVCGYFFCIL